MPKEEKVPTVACSVAWVFVSLTREVTLGGKIKVEYTQVVGSELKSPRKIRTRYVWWRICLGARMLAMYSRYLIGVVLEEVSDACNAVN